MTVLFFSPANTSGGAESSLVLSVQGLSERGHDVHVALPIGDEPMWLESKLKGYVRGFCNVKGMKWTKHKKKASVFQKLKAYLYASYRSKGWHLFPVIKLMNYIRKNKVDVVYTNTVWSIDAAIAAKMSGVPHVQHIREVTGFDKASVVKFYFQRRERMFKMLMRKLHRVVICNSEYTMNSSKRYFPEDKLRVVYNSVADAFFDVPSRAFGETIVVAKVANVTAKEVKNHQLFLRAAREVLKLFPDKKWDFRIYGKMPKPNDPYLNTLQNLIEELEIGDHFTFMGVQEALSIYKEVDVVVHTTGKESFGRIFAESMACKKPLVAVSGAGASELIDHGRTGFLTNESPNEIAKYIGELVLDVKRTELMIDNAYQYALTVFKETHVLDQLEESIKIAVNEK